MKISAKSAELHDTKGEFGRTESDLVRWPLQEQFLH